MRWKPTQAERALRDLLLELPSGAHLAFQYPLYGFIADFCYPTRKLVIEVDGSNHSHPEQRQRDEARSRVLIEHGYVVIRFTNERVLTDPDGVLAEILADFIALPVTPLPARPKPRANLAARSERHRLACLECGAALVLSRKDLLDLRQAKCSACGSLAVEPAERGVAGTERA